MIFLPESRSALPAAALAMLGVAACAPAPTPPPPPAQDNPALEVIRRASAAPAAIEHARVEMNQVEITHVPAGENALPAIERRRLNRQMRTPQADGSTVYTYRVHGLFEYRAPGLSWTRLQRSGGGDHANVILNDGETMFYFSTRSPESISRVPAGAAADNGMPALSWVSAALTEESKLASSIRLRQREVLQGELCEVVELNVPTNQDDPQSSERQVVYYIAVADALVRRSTESRGLPGRRRYGETTFRIDRAFVPENIDYPRFEAEVMSLLNDKALPPVVARMK
jgi:hypothetical protein